MSPSSYPCACPWLGALVPLVARRHPRHRHFTSAVARGSPPPGTPPRPALAWSHGRARRWRAYSPRDICRAHRAGLWVVPDLVSRRRRTTTTSVAREVAPSCPCDRKPTHHHHIRDRVRSLTVRVRPETRANHHVRGCAPGSYPPVLFCPGLKMTFWPLPCMYGSLAWVSTGCNCHARGAGRCPGRQFTTGEPKTRPA